MDPAQLDPQKHQQSLNLSAVSDMATNPLSFEAF